VKTGSPDVENLYTFPDDASFDALRTLVAEWMVIDQDISLQEALGKVLMEKGQTLSTAESCTGGYIAHLITSIPGSSNYYKGSVVSYANEIKEKVLHVDHGALPPKAR